MFTDRFTEKCRLLKDSHFTRKRKMPLTNLLLSVLFRKGRTCTMECRSFRKLFAMKTSISKPGYLKQRMKLNPDAFKMMAQYHAEQFYKDYTAVRTYRSYLVLACDGTSLNIPTTAENLAKYGNATYKGTRACAQIGLSCLFDVQNRVLIDMCITSAKFHERAEAVRHVDNAPAITGDKPCIYLFDRGYPSGEFFLDLMERKVNFLIRLGSASFKREQASMTSDDCILSIQFDRTRVNSCKKETTARRLASARNISLRFVRIKLDNGVDEYLVTNLSHDVFSTAEIGELYRLRWGIETVFDDLKNKWQIENFSGEKPVILEQDIYATMYLSNIANDIMQDVAAEQMRKDGKPYKYPMQLNRNIAIGILKEDLIHVFLERRPRKKYALMESIMHDIESNLLPIRPDRHFKRPTGLFAGKYSNVRKRCF